MGDFLWSQNHYCYFIKYWELVLLNQKIIQGAYNPEREPQLLTFIGLISDTRKLLNPMFITVLTDIGHHYLTCALHSGMMT